MLTLKQHVYQIVRDKLLSGAIEPGSRLSDDLLARELGISRSPVREALGQLASEGLIEHRPRSGAFVRQPSQREVRELYEIRGGLERYAARKAASNISAENLAQLQRLCDEMQSFVREYRMTSTQTALAELRRRISSNDLAFHTLILEAADNSQMTKLVTDYKILLQIFVNFVPAKHDDLHGLIKTCRYHRRIAQALEKRDVVAAGAWMVRHIHSAMERVLARFEKQMAREAASEDRGD
jgi:DNA-binding GntR family transcriptional regulator